jgi:hypothetical protein
MSQGHATQLLKHGMAEITPGLRLHYATAWDGNRIIVLLHVFPQTGNKEQSSELMRARGFNGYGDLKPVNLPKPEASNGKCWCGYMTVGGKRMYVVLTSHRFAARGETPVLPVYGGE